jgi:ABC-type spermidine/putrescine transport system permease subunit II
MTMLATSYEGFAELMVLMWTWPVAAGLALIALILAFWHRARRASLRCAIASMAVSAVVGLPIASLARSEQQRRDFYGLDGFLFLLVVFAPLAVAVAVFWFDRRSLKRDTDVTHAAS